MLYLGLIFYCSSQPLTLPLFFRPFPHIDKVIHFGIYGVMGGLCYLPIYLNGFQKPGILTVFLVGFYGLSDEVHQLFVPGRSFELLDLLADTTGAAVAALMMGQLIRFLPRWVVNLNPTLQRRGNESPAIEVTPSNHQKNHHTV